ncbi:unnamed protein product [Moneuplotes crassus]|uniref:Uncharacterized protein n=1 Tax=Euplotes crassus TaxID=5936 RepID=A0AAD1XVW3_EUPCR|nr:unnamed protein product [Moneuplotes crassus]
MLADSDKEESKEGSRIVKYVGSIEGEIKDFKREIASRIQNQAESEKKKEILGYFFNQGAIYANANLLGSSMS